jgi:hypothetical protein
MRRARTIPDFQTWACREKRKTTKNRHRRKEVESVRALRGEAQNPSRGGTHESDGASLATRRRGLIPGTTQNEQRKTTLQRLARDKGARQLERDHPWCMLGLQRLGTEAQSDASGCRFALAGDRL